MKNRDAEYGSPGSNSEYYETREYSDETPLEYRNDRYGEKREPEEQKECKGHRKRIHKAMRHMLGTAVVVMASVNMAAAPGETVAAPEKRVIELTTEEKLYFQELERLFQNQDYEGALVPIVGEISYNSEGKPRAYDETTTLLAYDALVAKAGWKEEEPWVILMEEPVEAVEAGSGLGFCLQETKLYYGEIEDGLPHGQGICYSLVHNYYAYSEGTWNHGYINGYARFHGHYYGEYGDGEMYVLGEELREGTYADGKAHGTIKISSDCREDGGMEILYYKTDNGRVVLDDAWESDESGSCRLYSEDRKYSRNYPRQNLRSLGAAQMTWLPVEKQDAVDEQDVIEEGQDD